MFEISERLDVKTKVGPKTGKRFWTIYDKRTDVMIVADNEEFDAIARLSDVHIAAEAENARLRAAQSWISVTDRLPDEPGIYFVYYLEDQAYGSLWFSPLDGGFDSRVTHWMPLPEPPQEPQP